MFSSSVRLPAPTRHSAQTEIQHRPDTPISPLAWGTGGVVRCLEFLSMFIISQSEIIRCSPEAAFAFAGDYANDPSWRHSVVSMEYETSGLPAVGTRTREQMRSLGITAITVAEVIEYSPTRTAFRTLSGPVECFGSRDFCEHPPGTRFTYTLTLRARGMMRLVEPLLGALLTRQVRADLRRLKQRLESVALREHSQSTAPA